jgi:RecA-family ATPase
MGNLKTFNADDLLSRQYPPREMVIDPWLRQGETVMVWAATGVGKTWFTLSLAVAIAGGGKVGEWFADKARRVLVIDGEMHQQDLADRLRFIGDTAVTDHDMAMVGRRECQDFRVWSGIMGKQGVPYVSTQRACHPK